MSNFRINFVSEQNDGSKVFVRQWDEYHWYAVFMYEDAFEATRYCIMNSDGDWRLLPAGTRYTTQEIIESDERFKSLDDLVAILEFSEVPL